MAFDNKDGFEQLEHLVKKCPYCNGTVLEVAIKCRHCGKFVYDPQTTQTSIGNSKRAHLKNYLNRSWSAFFQFAGLVLIIFGMVKLETIYLPMIVFPLGMFFWMIGAVGVRWKKCSNCGCVIAHKELSKCPRCYFEFAPPEKKLKK